MLFVPNCFFDSRVYYNASFNVIYEWHLPHIYLISSSIPSNSGCLE